MKTLFKAALYLKNGDSHRVLVVQHKDGRCSLTRFINNKAETRIAKSRPSSSELIHVAICEVLCWEEYLP